MKRIFVFLFFVLIISGVFAQSLSEEEKDDILEKLKSGEITTETISVLTHYGSDGMSSEQQIELVDTISDLDEDGQKVFWKSFWELSTKDKNDFVNSFGMESKNEFLNIFSDQYVKMGVREESVLKFKLKGDVDVGFVKTKTGQEFIKLGDKFVFLDNFKKLNSHYSTYTFDYDSETDTLVKFTSKSSQSQASNFSVKGGRFVIGHNDFYLLDEDGKLDKDHELSGMKKLGDSFELDLTEDKYKIRFGSYGEGNEKSSSIELKDGMRISSIEESDKVAEVVFGEDGKVKTIEDLKMRITDGAPNIYHFETFNGKMRFVSDVDDLFDSKGGIDGDKMKEFLLEGKEEGDYDGYFIFDKDGGEGGKPFIGAVTNSVGIGEFGRLTNEELKGRHIDTVGKLFGVDLQNQKEGSEAPVLDVKKLEDIEATIRKLRLATSETGETATEIVNFFGSMFGAEEVSVRAEIDAELKKLYGVNYKISDYDYVVFTDDEFLNSVEETVSHFKDRLIEDPNYFEDYKKRIDLSDGDFVNSAREDFNSLMGVVGKVDSVYDSMIPKSKVYLNTEDGVGTLIVGGNVEVYDGDLKITENLKGVSFGSKIATGDDSFSIDSSIGKIYTTNSENVWEIRENSQGKLEPFLVGKGEPSVKITNLNFYKVLTAEDVGWSGWWHDFFSRKSQEITGRELNPVSVSLVVSEGAKKIMDMAAGAVRYYNIDGAYAISVKFHADIDSSGASLSGMINKEGGNEIVAGLGQAREGIKYVVGVLNKKSSTDPFLMEKELKTLVKGALSGGSKNPYTQQLAVDLLKEVPSSDVVVAGVDFVSEGYTSYESIRDINVKKINQALNFIDNSLGYVQEGYEKSSNEDAVISFVRKENGDIFLKNSKGEVLSIDSEIEPFVGQVILMLASGEVKRSQNQVLNQKNFKLKKEVKLSIKE